MKTPAVHVAYNSTTARTHVFLP